MQIKRHQKSKSQRQNLQKRYYFKLMNELMQNIFSIHLNKFNPSKKIIKKYPIKEAWVDMEQLFDPTKLNQAKQDNYDRDQKKKEKRGKIRSHPMHIHSSRTQLFPRDMVCCNTEQQQFKTLSRTQGHDLQEQYRFRVQDISRLMGSVRN